MQLEECIVEGVVELDPIRRPWIVGLFHSIERNDSLKEIFLLLGEIPILRYRPSDLLQRQRDPFCEVSGFDFQRPGDRSFHHGENRQGAYEGDHCHLAKGASPDKGYDTDRQYQRDDQTVANMHAAKRRDQGMIRRHRAW